MMHEVSETKPKAAPKPGLLRSFRALDIYHKIDDNYRVQTFTGAVMSLAGWAVIVILVLAETKNFMTPTYKEHMVVDTSLGQQLRINVNMTFHSLTCAEVHLDAMDVAGYNQLNVEHEMMKQRISSDGKLIGKAGVEIIGEGPLPKHELPPDYCGDCYGAETETLKCCNTCNELLKAYQIKQWSVSEVLRNSTQCLYDRAHHFASVGADEGCRVTGVMKVNKVAGNFHIAHGDSIVRDGKHIHQFNPATAPSFNVSHTIHSISFGDPYPSMKSNPMDNFKRLIKQDESTGLYQYFIRVIPTIYTNEFGSKIYTNQFTLTDRFRPLAVPKLDGTMAQNTPQEAILPGIFFIYEVSPFMIEASKTGVPLLHFLTKICAIIGGVFTVTGVIDSLIYRMSRLFKK